MTDERSRSARLRVVIILVNLVAVAGASMLIGHVAWRTSPPSRPVAAPSPNGSAGSGLGSPGFGVPSPSSPGFGFGAPPPSSSGTSSNASGGPADASAIAKDVNPGLVDINTQLSYESEEAAGTGMVLTRNGEVLTNNHVIEDATSISATDVGNGKTYSVQIIGYDRMSDVALLQLEKASNLQTVHLASSASVRVGEAVVGIGNAEGTGGTPSYAGGAVTALNQSITASDEGDGTSEQLSGLVGTNAGIEPGDSGGPLVNSSGAVVGMDTAASAGFEFVPSSTSKTQAFSIPINQALRIANSIKSGASSTTVHIGATAFLGVEVTSPGSAPGSGGFGFGSPSPITPTTPSGAEIVSVFAGSPAAEAGLTQSDTITAFAGERVSSPDALTTLIEAKKPGAAVSIVYVGPSGQQATTTVRLASGPPQ